MHRLDVRGNLCPRRAAAVLHLEDGLHDLVDAASGGGAAAATAGRLRAAHRAARSLERRVLELAQRLRRRGHGGRQALAAQRCADAPARAWAAHHHHGRVEVELRAEGRDAERLLGRSLRLGRRG